MKIQQISAFVLVFLVPVTEQSFENGFCFPLLSEMPTFSNGLEIKRHLSTAAAFENSIFLYGNSCRVIGACISMTEIIP